MGRKQKANKQHSDHSEYVVSLSENSILAEPNALYDQEQSGNEVGNERKMGRKNHGNWRKDEEARFMEHMLKHEEIYRDKDLRRTHKIFKKMGKFVKTRSSEQCRSHHQKLELKLKSYDAIISHISQKIKDPVSQEESDDGIHYSPIRIEEYLPPGYLQSLYQKSSMEKVAQRSSQKQKQNLHVNFVPFIIQKDDSRQKLIRTGVDEIPKVKQEQGRDEQVQESEVCIKLGAEFYLFDEQMDEV